MNSITTSIISGISMFLVFTILSSAGITWVSWEKWAIAGLLIVIAVVNGIRTPD